MRHAVSHLLLLLALVLGGCAAKGQDSSKPGEKRARTPEDYTPRTLKEIAEKGEDDESIGDMSETMMLHGDLIPSRVRVNYGGSSRLLPQLKKEVLRQWAMRFAGAPDFYTKPYQTELLFIEDGVEYWLVARTDDLAEFNGTLKKGDAVELYAIRLGRAKVDGKWEQLVLVENFEKVE